MKRFIKDLSLILVFCVLQERVGTLRYAVNVSGGPLSSEATRKVACFGENVESKECTDNRENGQNVQNGGFVEWDAMSQKGFLSNFFKSLARQLQVQHCLQATAATEDERQDEEETEQKRKEREELSPNRESFQELKDVNKTFAMVEQLRLDVQDERKKVEADKGKVQERRQQVRREVDHTTLRTGQPVQPVQPVQPDDQVRASDSNKKKKKKGPTTALLATPAQFVIATVSTTKKPHSHQSLHSFLLHKKKILKKKKLNYLEHVKQVLYPFVKFATFFTVLNPFTLVVFLFSLLSPAIFAFLGFVALSLFVKPVLYLILGLKNTASAIDHQKHLIKRRQERLRLSRRPITIHKHYYLQKRISLPSRVHRRPKKYRWPRYSPLLPSVKAHIKHDGRFGPSFVHFAKSHYGG